MQKVETVSSSEEEKLYPEITRELVLSKYGRRIHIVDHPYVQHQLAIARNIETGQNVFRKTIYRIGRAMGYEFLRTMPTELYELETPLTRVMGTRILDSKNVLIVLILRAATPFVEGLYKYFPEARAGIISAYRGSPPDFPVECKYEKIPQIHPEDTVIIADPMLATGHTGDAVAKKVLEKRKTRLAFISVVAAPYGVKYVLDKFENSDVWTASLDPFLNKKGYIVPGLGDAGDRCFGSPDTHTIK